MLASLFGVTLLITSIRALVVWPRGQYCLPMPLNRRCPLGWESGYRSHTTEGNNTIGGDVPYSVSFGGELTWGFCCKTRVRYSRSSRPLPKGTYCVFRKGRFCPRGFNEGSLFWDDKDKHNANIAQGALPDGFYDQNTQIYFCCRDDGFRHLSGFPQCNSLVLMRYGMCPQVEGYLGPHEGFIQWNTEERFNNDHGTHSYPDGYSLLETEVKLQFCSYTSSYYC